MITCLKCDVKFSNIQKIDGKKRNLSNRKFCLQCSPFGKHNTKKDPSIPTKIHSRYKPYSEWTKEEKEEYLEKYYQRGINRKKELVKIKGGGCKYCGYSKCLRALTFHHRDPATKSLRLTTREIAGSNWKSVLEEIKKCDLLCHNCHMEIEDEIAKKNRRY